MAERPPLPWILLAVAAGVGGWALGRATAPEHEADIDGLSRASLEPHAGPTLDGLPARGGGPRRGGAAPTPSPTPTPSPDGGAEPSQETLKPTDLSSGLDGGGPTRLLSTEFLQLPGGAFGPGAQAPATAETPRIEAARKAMAADPEEATRLVEDLLASSDPIERTAAYRILGTARHPSHRALVQRAMDEARPVDDVRALIEALAAYKGPGWGAVQMTGPPDTPMDGDLKTAWASKSPEMGEVWIELDYPTAVVVDAVRIHETLGPGCVARILLAQRVDRDGVPSDWREVWAGTADKGTSPCWFEPLLENSVHTRHVRLIVDTERVPGWNEIDAVELVGGGLRQWAHAARAGSSYAD